MMGIYHRLARLFGRASAWCDYQSDASDRRYRRRSGQAGRIVTTPGVLSGAARLDGTRIAVANVRAMRESGITQLDILRMYPTLVSEDLAACEVTP
jgi:uncharacterized protein (DUF433 family)